jgi:hypothetical protein
MNRMHTDREERDRSGWDASMQAVICVRPLDLRLSGFPLGSQRRLKMWLRLPATDPGFTRSGDRVLKECLMRGESGDSKPAATPSGVDGSLAPGPGVSASPQPPATWALIPSGSEEATVAATPSGVDGSLAPGPGVSASPQPPATWALIPSGSRRHPGHSYAPPFSGDREAPGSGSGSGGIGSGSGVAATFGKWS